MPATRRNADRKLADDREERQYKRKQLRLMCQSFICRPIEKMTTAEAKEFASKVAETSAGVLRIYSANSRHHRRSMNQEECETYSDVIFASINYFNSRDAEHQRHMNYLSECQRISHEREEQERLDAEKKKNDIIVHIV